MEQDNNSLHKTLKAILAYLESSENVITNILRSDLYNDYPFFFQFMTDYLPRNGYSEADLIANGISLNKNEAFIKAVMETIERWYLSNYSEDDLIIDSYHNVRKKNENTLNPQLFSLIANKQLLLKSYAKFCFSRKSFFYWTSVEKLFSKEKFFIPAQLIYCMNVPKKREPIIRLFDSTGAAAGTSIEQALYNAICELIERDAYAITYYNKLNIKKVLLDNISDKNIRLLINDIQRRYFKVLVFDISLDINIPVFLCILIDETNIGPKVTVGLKCSLFWEEAIYGAIMEALQSLTSTRDMMNIKKRLKKDAFNKIGISTKASIERVLYWADSVSVKNLDFLISSPYQSPGSFLYKTSTHNFSYKELLHIVGEKIKEGGIRDIYWKKTTPETLNKFDLYGVKVVIPKLQSISLDSRFLYFGGERLYTVPVELGFRKQPIKENQLNRLPHPLP